MRSILLPSPPPPPPLFHLLLLLPNFRNAFDGANSFVLKDRKLPRSFTRQKLPENIKMSGTGLECYVFRARTRQINPKLLQMCDLENPNRLEGHSLHAVASQQRHFVLAPCISDGIVEPCYYICIWSCSLGHNSLWHTEPPADIKCNLFHCYFPSQFTGMQFIMAGTFGSAYRAVWNRGDGSAPLNVVIKRIDLARIDSVDGQDLVLVLREKMLLQRLHNDHISSIILQYNDPKNSDIVYFVLEDGGPSTLDNFLRDAIHSQNPIMPSNIVTIMGHVSRSRLQLLQSRCIPVPQLALTSTPHTSTPHTPTPHTSTPHISTSHPLPPPLIHKFHRFFAASPSCTTTG